MVLIRPTILALAFAALLLVLRFAGFLSALFLSLAVAAAYVYRSLRRHARVTSNGEPLEGVSLHVEDRPNLRFASSLPPHVEQIEIGATSPGQLQFVLISARRRATVKLSAEQARWLAGALNHWADSSEAIPLH
jgi:hypothetical protein